MQTSYNQNNLYYEEHGSGNDVIVLIHGFLSSSSYWKRVRPGLVKAGYRVISIDLLGFGRAAEVSGIDYNYNDQVEYVDKIISHLNFSQPVNLIGHSMGALIAARYSVVYPTRLKSLILFHPPLYVGTVEANQTLRNTNMLYRYLLGSKYRNIAWEVIKYLLPTIIADHAHDAREKSLRNVVMKAELFDDLAKVQIDTILIVGLRDRPIYQRNLSNNFISPSVRVIKENTDHHSPIKRPHLALKTILDFVKNSKYVH